MAAAVATIVALTMTSGAALAAPTGKPDVSVPFSSVVYGTGCLYTVTVQVNSSGTVYFWESRGRAKPRYIGSRTAVGANAVHWWTPNRIGNWTLYAVQNGKKSQPLKVAVRQGYGGGGLCFAL